MSSCLNSCGLCGRAYQLPGWRRAGTRKSRAPSGVLRVSVGVSTSTNPRRASTSRAARLTSRAQPDAPPRGRRGAGRGSGARAGSPPPPRRARRSGTAAGALALSTSTSVGDDLDLAGGQVGVLVALGPRGHLAGDLQAVLRAELVGDLLVADHDLDDPGGLPEVDEGDAAVVAPPGDPSGEGHGLADVLGAEAAGVMGADHCCSFSGMTLRCAEVLGGWGPAVGVGVALVTAADVLDLVGTVGAGEPHERDATALGGADLLAELLRARGHLGRDPARAEALRRRRRCAAATPRRRARPARRWAPTGRR